jgi:FAD/FMN-containing dehydrogenase
MKRRAAIALTAAAAAAPFVRPGAARARGIFHRVRPGDPQWPSAAEWGRLEREVGGRLLRLRSPFEPCAAAPNGGACNRLFADLKNPYYVGNDPALTQTLAWTQAWSSQTSPYAVAAKHAHDVAAAVNFARAHDLRIVVKGGGHSYLGTSNAPDSLLIWTRHMNEIVLRDAFVPVGCSGPGEPAVTLGAGVIWLHAYDAVTTKAGRYVQGGGCATVGVAGLVQSGGFGSFSKHYGTAASHLLEAEVVTADGLIHLVNPCTSPDLFWALKGGGGGTFGIVTKVTLRLHDLPEYLGAAAITVKASSDDAYRRLVAHTMEFYAKALFGDQWGEQIGFHPDNTLNVSMVSYGLDPGAAKAVWQPYLDWVAANPGDYTLASPPIVVAVPARNWWDAQFIEKNYPFAIVRNTLPNGSPQEFWWSGDADQVAQVLYAYDSLWLPKSLLEGTARLSDALFKASRSHTVALHFNKGLAGAPPEAIAAAKETATNPDVLDAFALAISASGQGPAYPGVSGHEPDAAAAERYAPDVLACMNALRELVPNGGSYVSESNFFEPRWQRSYWGANYAKLARVKKTFDPDGLFFVHHGVGSEGWSDDGFTRR